MAARGIGVGLLVSVALWYLILSLSGCERSERDEVCSGIPLADETGLGTRECAEIKKRMAIQRMQIERID